MGLVAFALGAVLLFAAFDDWSAWLTGGPTAVVVVFLLAAAHLTAAGFFVLLSGLEGRDLSSDRRARRAVLVKLAGANLGLPVVGLLIYADSSGSGEAYDEPWLILGALALYLPLARTSLLWIRRGWKYEALSADALLAADARAPVL